MVAKTKETGLKKPKPRGNASVRPPARKRRPILKWSLISGALLITATCIFGYMYWQSLYDDIPDLPPTAELWEAKREPAIEFLDRDGDTLAIRGPRYGRAVNLDTLPPHVPRAFIAAEDKRFYEHDGADNQAILRAAVSNLMAGRTVSGASTLTQQLVKTLILSPEQTMKRKAQEIRLARQLEKRLSKNEILELYLNRVYFGSGFYGLGAASRFYFDKDPSELTLAEASLLATLPQAPSRLALDNNMKGAKQRQAYVLEQMVEAGFITQQNATIAYDTDVTLAPEPVTNPQLGFVLDEAKRRAEKLLPELPDDLVITVTLDDALQAKVTSAIDARMESEAEAVNAGQAAALLFNTKGEVIALYGGRDYLTSQFNRVTQAKRQPGSSFKPFVYAAALEAGISPYDQRVDRPVVFGKWRPKNFSRSHVGPTTVADALRDSLNTIAAILGNEVGEEKIVKLAGRFGISEDLKAYPSLSLGSQEITLWDMTRAYGPFMMKGDRLDPYLIMRIETSRGEVLYERGTYDRPMVFGQENAKLMTGMMAKVVRQGTGRNAAIPGWPVAGKTGTSQSSRDAWFIGYSAETLGGVWTGNDDDSPMKGVTGGGLPARIWADIMKIAHEGRTPAPLDGANSLIKLSPEQQARVAYYRDLSMAFAGVAGD